MLALTSTETNRVRSFYCSWEQLHLRAQTGFASFASAMQSGLILAGEPDENEVQITDNTRKKMAKFFFFYNWKAVLIELLQQLGNAVIVTFFLVGV